MVQRRILIVDNNDDIRAILEKVLRDLGHAVITIGGRAEALAREDLEDFDLIISDLTEDPDSTVHSLEESKLKNLSVPATGSPGQEAIPKIVKAFKVGAANFLRLPYDKGELLNIVEKTLSYKLLFVDDAKIHPNVHEKIDFELPSDLTLMDSVLHYLTARVSSLGVIKPESSNLFVALDEAFVNAVKHGNKSEPGKLVRITAELSSEEARFSIEDEGEGFDVQEIPDPLDPANLFKSSGRGVLLIYNIMDEVKYNERGNRLTMVKRPEGPSESFSPADKISEN